MKDRLMKKVAASVMAAAIAVSVLPYAGMMDVSAKAPFVKLHTTFKTLTAGQTYKLKLKNNTLGWKVTKAVSKDNMVCEAAGKESYVKLSAKGEGRTTVKVTLKTAKRKGANATKRLSCRVNVKPLGTMEEPEMPPVPETKTDVTVGTQAELNKALANQDYTKITLQTNETVVFSVPTGEHANVDFIVNAPNADVENYAVFRSVTIQDIKENTWKEHAKGNFIKILDEKASIVIDAAASVKEIIYAGTGAGAALKLDVHGTVQRVIFQTSVKAAVTVAEAASVSEIKCSEQKTEVQLDAKGTVGSVDLEADAALDITGNPKAAVAVTVAETAKGSQVKSSAKVAIIVKAEISIQLEKGAEGSSIEVTAKEITASITNKTGAAVELKQPDSTVRKIAANTTVSVKNGQAVTQGTSGSSGTTYVPSTGSSGGSSSNGSSPGGSNKPTIDTSGVTTSLSGTVVVSGTSLKGVLIQEIEGELHSSGVVTQGALSLTISGFKIPESVKIEDCEDGTDAEEYKNQLENGYIIENYYKVGDRLAGHKMFPVRIDVVSGDDIEIYFDVTLNEDKWISEDGIISASDWTVTQLTKEEADKILNSKD